MFACIESSISSADLEARCYEVLDYLSNKLKNGHYSGRSFYGETYTALAMASFDYEKYKKKIDEILEYYKKLDKTEDNFHWEFNNYAILKLRNKHPEVNSSIEVPLTYRGVKCTNWTLLRCVCKLMEGRDISEEDPKGILRIMQQDNGLVLDEPHVASFQYHCFIVSLVYELYSYTNDQYYLSCFKKGVDYIENFTLRNGDTLLIGRGQEQIFGYGALIHIYCVAYKVSQDVKYKDKLIRVLKYIFSYWNSDTILPLVLNKYEKQSEETLKVSDKCHLGWYSYNNYFDYLPFFAYYLCEVAKTIKKTGSISSENVLDDSFFFDKEFLRMTRGSWELVMGCKRYASANALTFPYIMYNEKPITSVCGGEDYFDVGYYQQESISLPYGRYNNVFLHLLNSKKYFRKVLRSLKEKNLNLSDDYLWIFGNICLYLNKANSECGIKGENSDYYYFRKIIIEKRRIRFIEEISFKKHINYSFFVPLNIMFPSIEQISNRRFKIPYGILEFDDDNEIMLDKCKFMTAKTMVDRIIIKYSNYKPKSKEKIIIGYSIISEE